MARTDFGNSRSDFQESGFPEQGWISMADFGQKDVGNALWCLCIPSSVSGAYLGSVLGHTAKF